MPTFSFASLSHDFAFFPASCSRFPRVSRSAMISSALMTSRSLFGSILPSTWCTFSSSNTRTTCSIASTSRILARNLFPRPSHWLAHLTSPAISTNSTVAGTIFLPSTVSLIFSSRSSATFTIPVLGSIVQNGKFPASAAYDFVSALNRVDLPTFGSQTIPTFMIYTSYITG